MMSFLWVTESEGLRSKSKTPLKSAILFYRLMQISNQPSIRIYSYLVACMADFYLTASDACLLVRAQNLGLI